jgi:hypothetical protein
MFFCLISTFLFVSCSENDAAIANNATELDKKYGSKAQSECSYEADNYLRSVALHDFAYDKDSKGFFGVKFDNILTNVKRPLVVTYVSHKAKLQNGFGAHTRIELFCDFNTQTKKAEMFYKQ